MKIFCSIFLIIIYFNIISCESNYVKIVNGNLINKGKYPWLVSIQMKTKKGLFHICGGSLITSKHILTAAHCSTNPFFLYRIILGAHDLEHKEYIYHVKNIYIHSDYTSTPIMNDIAIMEIMLPEEEKEQFDDSIHDSIHDINPIANKTFSNGDKFTMLSIDPMIAVACLPKYDLIPNELIVTGWGVYDQDIMATTRYPYDVKISYIPSSICSKKWFVKWSDEWNGKICGNGDPKGGPCFGDSGGPLMGKRFNKLLVFGLVSYGKNCRNTPVVYTKVSHYIEWIEFTTKEKICSI